MVTSQVYSPRNILLAVDGSENSLAAAHFIRDLSLPPGSSVTVVAVLTLRQTPGRPALLVAFEKAQATLQGNGVQVTTGLLHGHPAEALMDCADGCKPDLIVLGAKGLRATFGILLGGVAQQVIEYIRWPVLVVRAPYQGLRRVLLVTDGSPPSQRAVDYLAQFPPPVGIEVRVMHVLPPLSEPHLLLPSRSVSAGMVLPMSSYEADLVAARPVEAEEREGQAILAQAIEALTASHIEATSVLVRGDAATEMIEYIKTQGIDLVVAGGRGLSQVKGWLLGSVSRKLVHYAGCSTLIVKESPGDNF